MVLWCGWRLSDRALAAFGSGIGALLYAAMPAWRRTARENLRRVFGGVWSQRELERVLRENFRHYGRLLCEFLVMPRWSSAPRGWRMELRGTEVLDAALAAGRGVILVSAHFGNWELLAASLARAGYPLTVIAREADDAATNQLINSIRRQCGYRVIARRAVRAALECLRRNELLAIMADQNADSGAIFVDFFGYPAATATGPAVLARRTGAAVVPVFACRRPDGTHQGDIFPPVDCPVTNDREADIRAITGRLTSIIEARVRATPEQWLWIHKRWKRQLEAGGRATARVSANPAA